MTLLLHHGLDYCAEKTFTNSFTDPGFTPINKSLEKEKLEGNKTKWTQWSPLTALTTKSEKKKTLDDSAIDVISLFFYFSQIKFSVFFSRETQ